MTSSQQDLIRYRLEKAQETLKEARVLADAGLWNGCVNRLYYSCFYAVWALLSKAGLSSAKHTGTRGLFNLHFVKPGRVSPESGRLYNTLFTSRTESDYVVLVRFDEDTVRPWISSSEDFIQEISALCVETSETDDEQETSPEEDETSQRPDGGEDLAGDHESSEP